MMTLEPTEEQIENLKTLGLNTGPLIVINLLRYRIEADYSKHPEQIPCSGRAAYLRFITLAYPIVNQLEANLIFRAPIRHLLVAPPDERWDDVSIIEWPAVVRIQELLNREDYKSITFHRIAALEDSRVLICQREAGDMYGRI